MENTIKFGDRLRELRKGRGMQQSELGKLFGLSPSAIGSYERGLREPSYEHLVEFANYFNVSTDFILGKSDESLTVEDYMGRDSMDFFDVINKQNITIHGYALSDSDKRRIGDIAVGLFWTRFTQGTQTPDDTHTDKSQQ